MHNVIIGGTGFIGEYLCRALIEDGVSVISIGREEIVEMQKISGVRYENMDLDACISDLKKIAGEADRIVFALQPNLDRTRDILSILAEFRNIKKIVYLSTLLIYPDSARLQDEEVIPEPITDYEKLKYEEEKLFERFARDKDCYLSIARLGNVYGDVKNKGVVNRVIFSLMENQEFRLNSDGENIRDYIFVEDAACLLAGLTKYDGRRQAERFNICTGKSHSVKEIIGMLEEITGKKIKIARADVLEKSKSSIGNNGKIVKTLNFKPRYGLTKGLRQAYNNYLSQHKY